MSRRACYIKPLLTNRAIYCQIPGSKSQIIRLLLLSTIGKHEVCIRNMNFCEDVTFTLEALRQLGCNITKSQSSVNISSGNQIPAKVHLRLKDSATAFRFLLARLAFEPGVSTEIEISTQLLNRPHKPLLQALKELGAKIIYHSGKFHIAGTQPKRNFVKLDGQISSQFASALLLSAHRFPDRLTIEFTAPPVSKTYLDMTIAILHQCNVKVENKGLRYTVEPEQTLLIPEMITAEPDASSAGYIWALGTLSRDGCGVDFAGDNSLQGDFHLLNLLEEMGAIISRNQQGVVVRYGQLRAISTDMRDYPDAVPTLVFLSIFAEGETRIRGINHLRYKESDRVQAMIEELGKINVSVKYSNDELIIRGGVSEPDSIILDSHGDHRLALIFSCLKEIFPRIQVEGMNALRKSFPEWRKTLSAFGFSRNN
ncbi:MAG: 3-phosphoshikimate 1-carboxyvinyltransferase [Candidatus Cloacimonetes bacterium]|nr:3-phosphoshikimate 1-carboxyvinyltransferase [Candidatus Cloacimonadota bacterium]